jgi:hypothetical protein
MKLRGSFLSGTLASCAATNSWNEPQSDVAPPTTKYQALNKNIHDSAPSLDILYRLHLPIYRPEPQQPCANPLFSAVYNSCGILKGIPWLILQPRSSRVGYAKSRKATPPVAGRTVASTSESCRAQEAPRSQGRGIQHQIRMPRRVKKVRSIECRSQAYH